MESKQNFFEKHPRWTLLIINGLILGFVYGVLSIKVFNNDWTEHEPKNLKTIILQKYFGAIIDKNVGRFIKLREFRPNADFKERPSQFYIDNVAPNTLERKYYRIRTDENGFLRGTRRAHATPDIKIYFLGGSTTECLYMEEDERFPVRVEQSLEASLHKKVNVYNGGVSANESMHSLNILMNKVLPHKPNIVVLMHNINDLVMLRTQGTYDYQVSRKSHVQTSKNVFTRHELPEFRLTTSDQALLEEYSANLKSFIALCRLRGVTPVLMTQANRLEGDTLYDQFNERIREIGQQEGITVIDLEAHIPKEPQYLYDSYHYTALGAQKAAELITPKLQAFIAE